MFGSRNDGEAERADRVLLVEDEPQQREMAQALLENAGYRVVAVASGEEALATLESEEFDAVTTDLVMPGISGLELVERLRVERPLLPVVLVTARGSARIAAEALQRGAASYVNKACLRQELASTLARVVAMAHEKRERSRVLERLKELHLSFELDNDESLVVPLVNYLQDRVSLVSPDSDENRLMQIGVALQEAVLNAMHHGNLEVGSEARQNGSHHYLREIAERSGDPRFAGRRVRIEAVLNREQATFTVRDEGPGFDLSRVPDPTDPDNLLKASGRGLYLINAFMDEVRHNDEGNEITLLKRLAPAA